MRMAAKSTCFGKRVLNYLKKVRKSYEGYTGKLGAVPVFRGRKHCVSGAVEDRFAEMLAKMLAEAGVQDICIFVDMPMGKGGKKRDGDAKNIFYPDIAVCKVKGANYTVLHMFDLKVDLGWKRGEKDILGNLHADLKAMRAFKSLSGKDGADGALVSFKFLKRTGYDMVVCSSKNGGRKIIEQYQKNHGADETSQLFVLTDDELNTQYLPDGDLAIHLRADDVEALAKRLCGQLPLPQKLVC